MPNEAHDFAESPFDNEEEETEEEEEGTLEDKSAPSLCGVLPPPPPLKKLPSYLGESLHPTTNTICTQDVVWTWRRNSYINCNFKWADSRRSNSVSPCLCCGVITLFIIHCSHNFRFNICRLCISWQESFPSLTNQTAPPSHPSLRIPLALLSFLNLR